VTILGDHRSQQGAAAGAEPVAGAGSSAHIGSSEDELRRRRDVLAGEVAELHWDLGGLAYEMAIRDHFRLDVLVRRAAVLQERDAQLAEVERLLRMHDGGIAGHCAQCAAPHSRGAAYCWQCGSVLIERRASAVLEDAEPATHVMDALLAPGEAPPAGRE
jgi:hypothetical protein